MYGTLDLIRNKLIVHEKEQPNEEEDWEKDCGFMAPELPANIFAEEDVKEVKVILKVRTEDLTKILTAVSPHLMPL